MDMQEQQEFKNVYHKEKDPRVTHRMLAIRMICIQGKTIQCTADIIMYSLRGVQEWVSRHKSQGP